MKKRPLEGECSICGGKIIDTHAELPGTVGGGETWRHSDTKAYADRWEAGDRHDAVLGKVTGHIDVWEQKDYEAAKKEKA